MTLKMVLIVAASLAALVCGAHVVHNHSDIGRTIAAHFGH